MQQLIKIYNVYSYSELSDEAKEKAKEDYLNDYCRSEALTNIYMEDLKNIFPNSDLKIQWSLNGCQGDGVNIYGNLNINDIFNLPNVTDMKWIGDELTEKEIRTMKFYMSEYQEDIILPMNRRYCYCYINHIDFQLIFILHWRILVFVILIPMCFAKLKALLEKLLKNFAIDMKELEKIIFTIYLTKKWKKQVKQMTGNILKMEVSLQILIWLQKILF